MSLVNVVKRITLHDHVTVKRNRRNYIKDCLDWHDNNWRDTTRYSILR